MTGKENINEVHPLPPFLPSGARVLMLGSFPPGRERWRMEFYYPNFQNDMWRIFGLVFFGDKDYFLTADCKSFNENRIREFLAGKGIALSDTAQEVVRQKGNASDRFLEVVTPVDLEGLLRELPGCLTIVTTGQKATDTLIALAGAAEPRVGEFSECVLAGRQLRIYRMPSSSRAYPKPLSEKAQVYKAMFREIGMV